MGRTLLLASSPEMQTLLDKFGINYSIEPDTTRKKVVSIIPCDCLIAQTGSIVVTDGKAGSRKAYTDCDILLVTARTSQITGGLKDAMQLLHERLGNQANTQAVVLTGTTQTYTIEQEPITGVFGARQMAVFLVDD